MAVFFFFFSKKSLYNTTPHLNYYTEQLGQQLLQNVLLGMTLTNVNSLLNQKPVSIKSKEIVQYIHMFKYKMFRTTSFNIHLDYIFF